MMCEKKDMNIEDSPHNHSFILSVTAPVAMVTTGEKNRTERNRNADVSSRNKETRAKAEPVKCAERWKITLNDLCFQSY